MLQELPKLSENDVISALLTGSDDKLYAVISEKMKDNSAFSLRTCHERMIECAIFCIFSMSDNDLLFKSLEVLNLESIIDKSFYLNLSELERQDYLKDSTSSKVREFVINNPNTTEHDPTTLLHLLYWRDKVFHKSSAYPSMLSALSRTSTKSNEIWDMAFVIGIENKDIGLIKELYNTNEYALVLNGSKYLKSAIQKDFFEAVKWLYSMQIRVSVENNPFELLEQDDLAIKERAITLIMESEVKSLLPFLRCKKDISTLIELRDIDPVEAIASAENRHEMEMLLDL